MTPIVPQRPGRGAPRLAPLVGATAMAMVLTACVQTGVQAPIQYAAPGQTAWPTPAPAAPGFYTDASGAPALSSTYLGQPVAVTYAGGVAGSGIAPFYDDRLTAAPVYAPGTGYLAGAGYGLSAPLSAPTTSAAAAYASPTPIYDAQGYSTTASYVAPSAPSAVQYGQPLLSYAAPSAPAPIYDPAPPASYGYASAPSAGSGSYGVTLYDGRLPSAPVYAPGTSYVTAAAMAPIYDPQDAYRPAAQSYGQGYAQSYGQSYGAGYSGQSAAPIYDGALQNAQPVYAQPVYSQSAYAPPATSYASASPPIHDPWPSQSQSYGAVQTVQTINATPWAQAYAPAPQLSAPVYSGGTNWGAGWSQSPSGSIYGPGLGVALTNYGRSGYSSGDVLLRLSDADLRMGQPSGYAQPQPQIYADAPFYDTNAPANLAPVGVSSFGTGSYGQSYAPAPIASPQSYVPQTGLIAPYTPPSTLGGAYPRPYSVSGVGIYPSSPTPTGVASARAWGADYAAPAPIFAPGTPIYADPRNQRYVREIVRLPQQTPGLATTAASLRAGAILPASAGSYHVASGDTLYRIARSHGISVESLVAANGLTLNSVIHPGQPLFIPRGGIGPMVPVYETIASAASQSAARIETGSVEKASAPSQAQATGPRASAPEFLWPLHGALTAKRDAYGVTSVEVKGAAGAPVRAAAAGEAIHVEDGPQGVMVVLDHGGGWTSIHVGLAQVRVKLGERVGAGATLGVLAARPDAALVFELRRNNLPVDPTSRLRG